MCDDWLVGIADQIILEPRPPVGQEYPDMRTCADIDNARSTMRSLGVRSNNSGGDCMRFPPLEGCLAEWPKRSVGGNYSHNPILLFEITLYKK